MVNSMTSQQQIELKRLIQNGLPLCARPYQALAEQVGSSEQQVMQTLRDWQQNGLIKRLGLVVKHRALGYTANAMVVWDVPDAEVDRVGEQLAAAPMVTLCYQRPRQLPDWRYNLFCMIHGQNRLNVEWQVHTLVETFGLAHCPHELLFSSHAYKQCAGQYFSAPIDLVRR